MMTTEIKTYQGQFGEFTITQSDRWGVMIYRGGLILAGLSFLVGSVLILGRGATEGVLSWLTPLFYLFSLGLGVSLLTIHIYLIPLHRFLQGLWLIGILSGIIFNVYTHEYLGVFVYQNPWSLFGIGCLFAALTGIYFKEAFCFNRLETKLLTPLVPALLLGHLMGILPVGVEKVLLGLWAGLFLIFVMRKAFQAFPDDIGDKSVFDYLKQQKSLSAS